jgi:outer membrane protein
MRRIPPALPALVLPVLLLAHAVRAETKFGYVDMRKVVQAVDEGKQARANLERTTEERRRAIDAKSTLFQKMKADYEKQESQLAEDVKRKKQEEMQKAYLDLQKSASDAQEEMQRKEQEVLAAMQAKILQASQDVADKEGIAFVLTRDGVVVAPSAADLTNAVVRRYNERFPAGAGAFPDEKNKAKK